MSRRFGAQMTFDDFQLFQQRRRKILLEHTARETRVARWKDLKNWSSLGRLLLAIVHSLLRLRAIDRDRTVLLSRPQDDKGSSANDKQITRKCRKP